MAPGTTSEDDQSSNGTEDRQGTQSAPPHDDEYTFKSYPNRDKSPSNWEVFRDLAIHQECKKRLLMCFQNDRMVQFIASAMKSHGCELSFSRHFSCETCLEGRAAYDPRTKQIALCQNKIPKRQYCGIIAHELIHAFDDCRAKFNHRNIEHVACTEIRAANLVQCSISDSVRGGVVSVGDFTGKQKECVRRIAMFSVMKSRNMSEKDALAVIDKVWNRCYNDLEPTGRRYKPTAEDREIAFCEAYPFGYTEREHIKLL